MYRINWKFVEEENQVEASASNMTHLFQPLEINRSS